ncbi:MAG: Gfo/Idh/MocA family oxidoreductase [Acidobacteriota bacterium]
MDKIGVGVIGCGFVGRGVHVPALSAIEDANLVAVADADSYRLDRAVQKSQAKSGYRDYKELVEDPEISAVVVALPTPLHTKASLAAIQAGKHVLCEMPLASTLKEVDELMEAAEKKGVYLMPGLNFRFTPNYVKVKEMIGKGEFGSPSAVLYREFIPAKDLATQWPAGSWVWNVEESGGPLFTLSVWSIDLLRWLFETEVAEVHAATKYTPLEQFGGTLGYDACASLKLANGIMGCLQYSGSVTAAASISVLEVVGDSTCVLKATGNDSLTLFGEDPMRIDWDLKQAGAKAWGHYQQDEYFVRCIKQGRAPEITAEDARKAMEVAIQIAKSR